MLSQTIVAFTLAGAAAGLTVPVGGKIGTVASPGNVGPGMTSIKQVRRTGYKFNGAVSVYKTYLKYKVPIPDSLADAVSQVTGGALGRRAQGSVSATPIDSLDDAYISPVSIGTPAQILNLDFDTGSSDLWVFSSETPRSQVNGQTIYSPSKSSTAKKASGSTWSISYGDGSSSSGDVYNDVVTIGGLTVSNQAVECAQTVSSSFTSDPDIDGLVGLGFDSLNTVSPSPAPTFFDNAKSSLASPIFTADLKHQARK